ncbi:MAG TPA: hypothetical protein PK635_04470 [Actinomycetota bacterium]|nr:hypothetical protein [Actinomycetota bacterium]
MKTLIAAAVCCVAIAPVLGTLPSTAEPKRGPVPAGSGSGLGEYAKPAGTVEGFAAYVPQSSCDPKWRKGIRKFRDLVMQRYPQTQDWGSVRNCTDDGISEHLDGRAWDWHADVKDPKQFAAATDLINWLMAKGPDGKSAYWARRLGIMYIGYNKRIWGSYRLGRMAQAVELQPSHRPCALLVLLGWGVRKDQLLGWHSSRGGLRTVPAVPG